MADDYTHKLAETLRGLSDVDLAAYRSDKVDSSVQGTLAQKELERRARVHQHELDLKLVANQVRWMKFSAILTAASTLIGTIAGALLTMWLQRDPQSKQANTLPHSTQPQSDKTTSVDRIEKGESVPSKTP
jgi:hypothetical protein